MNDFIDPLLEETAVEPAESLCIAYHTSEGKLQLRWGAPGLCADAVAATLPEGTEWRQVTREEAEQLLQPSEEQIAAQVRAQRDALIAATDYLTLPDYPLDEETHTQVLRYRQALRDVPAQPGFPKDVAWPEKQC